MFQLLGIDRLSKIQQAGVYAKDAISAGAVGVRQILHVDDVLGSKFTSAALPVAGNVVDAYTVPNNVILEFKTGLVVWASAGTITRLQLLANMAGIYVAMASAVPAGAGSSVQWSGSVFLRPGDKISGYADVTVANAIIAINYLGVLWPNP